MMLDDLLTYLGKNRSHVHGSSYAIEEFLALAEVAERFVFDDLPLEPATVEDAEISGIPSEGLYRMPALTPDEWEFWHEGLIPVPAPICWYEFTVNGITSGLLLLKGDEPEVMVQRIEFTRQKGKEPWIIIDGIWTHIDKSQRVRITSNDKEALAAVNLESKRFVDINYGINPPFMIYLTLMINSQTTEVRKVKPDPTKNRLRRQLKKRPERNHTVVTIVPKRFIYQDEDKKCEKPEEVRHRRLHWRRTHVRVYNRGQPDERKIVISRFLVGRRDLGEVTHEYRVRSA